MRIQKQWEGYIACFDVGQMDEETLREFQRAFFAGAASLFNELIDSSDKRDQAQKIMDSLHEEIKNFGAKTLMEEMSETDCGEMQ